jgi:DivIVA domain-containing protein
VRPEDVERKEFVVGVRGYVREEVRAFLRFVARELAERDALIASLRQELDVREASDRQGLLRALGEEVARILNSADAAANELRAGKARGARANGEAPQAPKEPR